MQNYRELKLVVDETGTSYLYILGAQSKPGKYFAVQLVKEGSTDLIVFDFSPEGRVVGIELDYYRDLLPTKLLGTGEREMNTLILTVKGYLDNGELYTILDSDTDNVEHLQKHAIQSIKYLDNVVRVYFDEGRIIAFAEQIE
ncbi:hypothetical protein GF389_06200 [Candidatus Dojkabacteria bacterium]|nr:hypothetical protein [Candidatus Dojkabacteria bacterium]